ncbi:MAG: ring-hydroxylating dioxygenase ferredoxin reductase family protein [Acetobacteraceae bacterium]|nr:ring-hydroxylating dioxygenase ferredoxin reductase family protein [Acetobacteraceae bacterium]
MGFSIALNFEDGVTRFVECNSGETVADAAYRNGINIPLDCRDGACGTCKCRAEAGEYDPGSYIEDALTDEEAAEGFALACQMRPKTDVVVGIAASSEVCKTKGESFKAQLAAVERLSPTTIAFSLALDAGGGIGFLPGQYVNVRVPDTDERRSYSFSSSPGATEFSFLVRDIPRGKMSDFLRDKAAPGMPMEFIGPAGAFYLRDIRRPLLFLAGGTGLAPFLSMLGRIAATGSPHLIHMVYGVTNDEDLVELDRLNEFAAAIPGFTFTTCVAAETSTHPRKGYVTHHIEPAHLNGGDIDVYLCGPPPMVEAVRKWLGEQGMEPVNFYYEKFSPSGAVTTIGETHRKAA